RVWDPDKKIGMDGPVTDNAVATLLGQWHLETNQGKATPNFNLAGIKCRHPDQFHHQYFATKESGDGGITLVTVAGQQPANCFRAWFSLEQGVRGWLTAISGGYRETLKTLREGKGSDWAHLIGPNVRGKDKSWYTGPEENQFRGGYRQVVGDL